jgi:hypothetical protein
LASVNQLWTKVALNGDSEAMNALRVCFFDCRYHRSLPGLAADSDFNSDTLRPKPCRIKVRQPLFLNCCSYETISFVAEIK